MHRRYVGARLGYRDLRKSEIRIDTAAATAADRPALTGAPSSRLEGAAELSKNHTSMIHTAGFQWRIANTFLLTCAFALKLIRE